MARERRTDTQTHRRPWPIYISPQLRLTRSVMTQQTKIAMRASSWAWREYGVMCVFARHGSNMATGCSDCACDPVGTTSGARCDNVTGQCPCKPNVAGRACNRCHSNAFNLGDAGCEPCDCDVTGTVSTPGVAPGNVACDQNTGDCACLTGRVGRRCDQCADGIYVLHFITSAQEPCPCSPMVKPVGRHVQ